MSDIVKKLILRYNNNINNLNQMNKCMNEFLTLK